MLAYPLCPLGTIRTTQVLDREEQSSYWLTIEASDNPQSRVAKTGVLHVFVRVLDHNDHRPVSFLPIYYANVKENSPQNIVVVKIDASDGDDVDSQSPSPLRYKITKGDPQSFFRIDDHTGYITTSGSRRLDRETQREHELSVEVCDSGEPQLCSTVPVVVSTLTIQATDRGRPAQMTQARVVLTAVAAPQRANDSDNRAPQFLKNTEKIPVSDADQVGFTIGKLEAMDPDGDAVWWSIIDGNLNETFSLKADSGLLQLSKPVENVLQNVSVVILSIQISDGQLNETSKVRHKLSFCNAISLFTSLPVVVELSRSSTIRPQFSAQHYKTQISEKTAVGTQIYTVRARTSDAVSTVKPLLYGIHSIEDTEMEDKLRVEPRHTGKDPSSEFTAFQSFHGSAVGSSVVTVLAHDSDSGENGVVKYSITSGNELGFFSLDPVLGVLQVAKVLPSDHTETILTVRATDGGKYPLSDTTNVRIQTIDYDGVGFQMSRALYQRTIKDSTPLGTLLLVVSTRPNGGVRYSMKPPYIVTSHYDNLSHQASGAVSLIRWLTRERAKSIGCTVMARNRAGLEDTAKVSSSVLLADNSPLLVSATDKDIGPNSLIGYRLLNTNEPYFVVDFVTGAVRSRKPLDYEVVKEWIFYVQASDMGEPRLSSPVPAMIIVSVLDINDEKPVFTMSIYEVDLILPVVAGVVVARPSAVDKDTVGKLRYTIKLQRPDDHPISDFASFISTGCTSSFRIFELLVHFLTLKDFQMDVLASDGVHTATTSVRINIRKPNTEGSGFRFSQIEYNTNVRENTTYSAGESLLAVSFILSDVFDLPGLVTAIGAPEGVSVTYRIMNEREEVFIHSGTGLIALTGKRFDREEESVVRLLLQARTHEIKPQLAQSIVTIRVDDVNDCAPMFVGLPYDVVISSDSVIGEKALSVKAIDRDIGMNGIVRYQSGTLPPVFKLNKHDGKITVNGKLDASSVYRFEVVAMDQGTPVLKASEEVRVHVVERARPIFSKRQYYTSISEGSKKKTVVTKVKASSSVGGHLIYTVESGNDNNLFVIDMDTGVISVDGELDAEETAAYNLTVIGINDNGPRFEHFVYQVNVSESTPVGSKLLTVKAIDPDRGNGLISYATRMSFRLSNFYSNVQVEDVNDEAPRFSTPFASAVISDTATSGHFVAIMSATDEDTVSSIPGGHRFLYSIIEGDETLFSVSENSGEVTLLRPVDNDDVVTNDGKKILNVSVSDGLFTAYGRLTVSITVSGRRQPPPRFEQSQYVVAVRENNVLSNKTSILMVQARDGVAPLHYSIGSGESRMRPLRIEKLTGRIHPKIVFNYQQQNIYKVPLVVEDALGRRAFSTLTVKIVDENDCAPLFVVSKYTTSVSSGAREGEALLMVSAIDDDVDDVVEYTLVDNGMASSSFKLHHRHGTLSVLKPLDSLVGISLSLSVRATDQANPPHHATAEVMVMVLPGETPIPKFSNNHYLFVTSEDSVVGTVIGKLQQIDLDVAEVRFSIPDPPDDFPFTIERSSGKLIVRQALDREKRDVWRFTARVDAAGGAHSMTTVTVRLSDVNDNAPIFGSQSGGAFKVDAESGWLVVDSPLDRERQSLHELVVRATDEGGMFTDHRFKVEVSGVLILSSHWRLRRVYLIWRGFVEHLEVTDVNDEPPRFDENFYIVSVDGNHLSINQIIARVVVTDKDLPPFNNIRLFISRGNDDGLFKIDDSGKVSIARLNHVREIYNLTLLAFDGTHATNAIMMVTLTSSTSSAFECHRDNVIKVRVPEDVLKGSEIYHEESRVSLAGARYLLISSDPLLPFTVNQDTGSISVKAPLDAETRKKVSVLYGGPLLIIALIRWEREKIESKSSDEMFMGHTFTRQLELKGAISSCNELVEVQVLDVNDEPPVFVRDEFIVSIRENEPASHNERYFLTRVHAVDKDSGSFGRVKYSFVSGHDAFVIDSETGAITVNRPLDREQKQEYLLRVLAQDADSIKPRSTVVRITVVDQNDNPPVFEKSEYILQVMESESVGYTLITLRAIGGDDGETVNYMLRENGSHNAYVELDKGSGVLKLARGLDFEKKKLLSLTVIATDSGDPPLSTETTVTIQVLDENDNIPIFAKESYKAAVDENSPNGTKVVKVKAVDADSEHYGRVAYSIKGDTGPFHMDDQGWITVAGLLDRELKSYYRLQVEAHDGGEPAQRSVVTVVIDVNDLNDNAPVFVDCNMTAVVQEGVTPGHIILTLSITDADGPSFGAPFRVEVRGEGSKAFIVDEQYNLVTVTRFDHSKRDRFLLTSLEKSLRRGKLNLSLLFQLIAYDRGNRSTDCPITIFVREESRHPPRISPLRIHLNTLMGEFRGGIIGTIIAEDEDAGDMLRFSLVDGSILGPLPTESHPRPHVTKPHFFRVNTKTGEVRDHEIPGGLHAFNVSVTDGKFSTVSYVEVEVMSLEQDAVDHAVSLRIKDMTALEFFSTHATTFREIFARHLNVDPRNIQLLSVQETQVRPPRALISESKATDVDILFTVSRGGGRGMLKPDHVYTRLKHDFQSIADQSGKMKYQLTTEMCTPGVCQRGECRERVYLDDQQQTIISSGSVSFVAPRHNRLAECICPEGYGGSSCELEVNACARSPCHPWEMCVPSDGARFECICPPGSSGNRCSEASCLNEGRCLEEAELSVGGNGYFEMSIAHEMETRLELEVELKTTTFKGVILHADGPSDYHTLELVDGRVMYRWDAGSGEAIVSTVNSIADAQWHRVSVSRRGRRTRLQLDGADTKEGWSPTVTMNMICSASSRSVAKTRQGLRLYSATTGCRAMAATPCSEAPCGNGGTCHVIDRSYRRFCIPRILFVQKAFWYISGMEDACATEPCGLHGTCIPIPRQHTYNLGYICNCTHGFSGKTCDDLVPPFLARISLVELVIAIAIVVLIIAVMFAIVVVCRCLRLKSEDVKYGEHVHSVPHVRNPHMVPPVVTAPPPLPPRAFRSGNQMISNLEQAQLTGLPTVQVRPLPQREQLSSSGRGDSRSPSLVGSGKQWKRAGDYGSAADDLDDSGRDLHDTAALEALRRFGFRIPDEGDSPGGNNNRARAYGRCSILTKDALSSINQERAPLADSIQCLPTMEEDGDGEKWGDGVDRIGAAIQTERLRIESLTGRVKVGKTVLSPVVNDDDYMTMRPRRNITTLNESQRQPLLDNGDDSDDLDEFLSSSAPPPPSHKNIFNSRVYDDPPDRGGDTVSFDTSAAICDIDASDAEDLPVDSVL
uniref:Cadherin domain protein n=1 Tax=Angiostrongylus cantonensis TaxID=6313 RepID=A0A0K0DCV7_ANGCA